MKILLTGASGLVGHHVAEAAHRRGHEVIGLYASNPPRAVGLGESISLDLSDPNNITRICLDSFPDAIINAAAASNPAAVTADPDRAQALNVGLPERLAQAANHLSAHLIHLSSDMVFDGQKGPYRSTDQPAPMSLYGEQKLEAEKRVLEKAADYATVLRIPIQMGNSPYERRSVHEKLFEAWAAGQRSKLFTDEIRQPCSAESVAEVCIELLERGNLRGLFHWAGSETLSRFEMGQRLLAHFGLPESLIEASSARDFPTPRPLDLRMELEPLAGKLRTEPETFAQQLEPLVVPLAHRKWYHSL